MSFSGAGLGKIEVIMFFSGGAIIRASLCFWELSIAYTANMCRAY